MKTIKLYTDEDLRNATPPTFEPKKLDRKIRITICFFIFCMLITSLFHKY